MDQKRPTIIDFVEKYTAKYGEATFLRQKVDGVWTETSFNQTREQAHLLAAGFMALGLKKGEKVALISEGRNDWIFTELGILYAGAVNVPLSFKLESDMDLTFRINHSDSRFVVASQTQIEKIRRVIGKCPAIEKVIVMDPIELKEGEIYLDDVRKAGEQFLKEYPGEREKRSAEVLPDDYANISYTSGTTADPKGILLTHRNYTANVDQALSVISIDEGNVMLIILPLDHCFAHVAGFYTMMSYCSSIATVPVGANPLATLRNIPIAIKEVRPHVMLSVPALARNFKKNVETTIHKQGPKVEKLYNYALNLAISYNKEYWKIPIYWGMMIGSYHFYALNSKNYKRFKRIHNEATNPDGGYTGSIPAERALYFRNVYRRYRDYSVVAIVGSYLLQVIDANVFAYMQDFEMNDELTLNVTPTVISPYNEYIPPHNEYAIASPTRSVPPMSFGMGAFGDNAIGIKVGLRF